MGTIPIGGNARCRKARHYKALAAQWAANARSLANQKRSGAMTTWALPEPASLTGLAPPA